MEKSQFDCAKYRFLRPVSTRRFPYCSLDLRNQRRRLRAVIHHLRLITRRIRHLHRVGHIHALAAYSMPNYLATSGQDAHSINADPQFNNPSASDFTLAPSSPAIGAGINLGPNFQFDLQPGSAWPNNVTTASQSASGGWDIGAYVNKP